MAQDSAPIDGLFGTCQYWIRDRLFRQRIEPRLPATTTTIERSAAANDQYKSQFTGLHDRAFQ